MEKASKSEQLKRIRSELIQGRDLARRLQTHIKYGSSSSQESIPLFIEGLVNTYNMSISMLSLPKQSKHHYQPPPVVPPESRNEDHKLDGQCYINKSGKRRCIKRVKQVTLAKGAGLETALEDEYSWRKYGQKAILGSKYPRGYYRCTHKTTDGCLARKQVQRTDEQGPLVFNITYYGVHTCSHHQQQLKNSQLAPPNYEAPCLEHHPQQENDILQLSGSILPSNTTHNEPGFPPTASITPCINFESTHMNILSTDSLSFDAGCNPSFMSSATWFADNIGMGGGLESGEHSAITYTPGPGYSTVGLNARYYSDEQFEFDRISDIGIWNYI
ncbi:unnamed protein product [Rhodiola kirilowii]